MKEKTQYYVLKEKAVPEVLLKVVEAKRLLESDRAKTIQEATEAVGISRSSFYKYKDDIYPFHENAKGKNISFVMQMDDGPGLLSEILRVIASYHANVLTLHQTMPIGGIASSTFCVDILPSTGDVATMLSDLENLQGIHYLKILGRE